MVRVVGVTEQLPSVAQDVWQLQHFGKKKRKTEKKV
jgi:hypothetical protein